MGATKERIVAALREAGGELSSIDGWGITAGIAAKAGVTPSAVSQQLKKLEDAGVIGRHLNGKRLYKVWLTDNAPAVAPVVAPAPVNLRPRPTILTGRPRLSPVPGPNEKRLGEWLDEAWDRTDDVLVKAVLRKVDDKLAEYTDELAYLKAQRIELRHQIADLEEAARATAAPVPGPTPVGRAVAASA